MTDIPDTDVSATLLKRLTEEMYRQNAELLIKNKTLTILRHLSTQSLQYLDVVEVSQSVVNVLTQELGLVFALVSIYDRSRDVIRHRAITQSTVVKAAMEITEPLALQLILPSDEHNLIAKTIREKKEQEGMSLRDLFSPFISNLGCVELEQLLHVKQCYIMPIILDDKAIGSISLGLTTRLKDLSTSERESLSQITPVLAIAIDRARLYEETVINNGKLRELDKLKDEFLSIASHDLRTPMTAMKGYLYLLLKKAATLEPADRESLQRVYNSAERLIALINDMLDVSRIESGRMNFMVEDFVVYDLIAEVEEELKGLAEEREIKILVNSDKTEKVSMDRNKLHEVLINLVGNAIKFTPQHGTITISLRDMGEKMSLDITDTGIGIAKEDFPKLFSKFGRIDTSNADIPQVPGTGLGLYICQRILELSGGSIKVTSEVGKGSTFTCQIPKSKS